MSQISREHLIDGFAQEIQVTLPSIREDLASLINDSANWQNLEQVYRLFHNIKGSSAQLSLLYISGAARIAEDLLEELLVNGKDNRKNSISFIDKIARDIYEVNKNGNIKNEEIGRKLLTDTIIGFRELTGEDREDLPEVQSSIEIILKGESIVEKPKLNTPEECLSNSFNILELLKQNGEKNNNSVQTAFLLNELSSHIHRYVSKSGRDQHPQLEIFSETLIEFLFWLAGEPSPKTAQVSGLIENYLYFIEILANNRELVDPAKIDSITETMMQVKRLSLTTDTGISVPEPPLVDDFLGNQDLLLTEDDLLDTVEDDDFLIKDPFSTDPDDETIPEIPEFEPADTTTDDESDELREIFLLECEEHLHTIKQTLSYLDRNIRDSSALEGEIEQNMHDMRRAIHTLKGAAGMTGFMDLFDLAYKCEDLLDTIFDSSNHVYQSEIKILADSTGMIEIMARTPAQAEPEKISRITAALHDAMIAHTKTDGSESGKTIMEDSKETSTEWNDEDLLSGQGGPEQFIEPEISEESISPEPEDETAELQEIFLSECEEHLHVIGKALSNLEQQVVEPTTLSGSAEMNLSNMRRAIHTLKGAAGMIGFLDLSSFAHSCEDLLDTIFESADMIYPAEISILADSIDMIEIMARTPQKTDSEKVAQLNVALHSAQLSRTDQDEASAHAEEGGEQAPASLEEAVIQDTDEDTGQNDIDLQPSFDTGSIRVKLENLDEIVNLESELVVARITMEQGIDELFQTTTELNLAKEKLRKISQELETGFEVEALYGFGKQNANTKISDGISVQGSEFEDFDPIELDRYSQLSLIIRSLNELTIDVGSIHSELNDATNELKGHIARQQLMMSVMQDKLMRVRMTPMSSISRNFFRTVRGVSEELNKKVHLLIKGEDVFLDRFIWSKISDPIMHILRNAIDHGIETPEDRSTSGKPEQAGIIIEATQQGRQVVLRISDDGKGIDLDAIRRRLIEKQIVASVEDISDEDLLDYLFIPGFTTKQDISQISGRGVGLDVVRQHVQELRGSVRIKTTVGEGTTFEIRIPMTLALNRAIIITLDNEKYAIPFHDIIEVRKISPEEVIHGKEFSIKVGERTMPLRDLAAMLGLRDESIKELIETGDLTVIVVPGEKDQVALVVDTIVEQQEIIVKSLGSHLRHVIGISGATIMGEGSLVPILNTGELVAAERQAVVTRKLDNHSTMRHAPLKVLIVDDSVSVRQSVSRLIKSNGWEAGLATDGMDATEKIDDFSPDIIILDIEMPRMNGFEFMAFLRRNKDHQHIPVIMLTSRISEKHQKKAMDLGVNHYMSKPYQEEEFLSTIKTSVGRL